ncbi:hypothetical protein AB0F88_23705 [Streptosporangium sp. NPDC023963]|uniref:WD40/YVTN/BNR-like repeat-containing protein n=1 Tax=Streptosporangium sp. NPDC023963 TaxID=3155608 RepID=UPI0034296A75
MIMVGTQVSWWPDGIIWRSTDSGTTWSRIWYWGAWPDRKLRYEFDVTDTPWATMGEQSNPPILVPKIGQAISSMEIDPFDSDHMLFNGGPGIAGTKNLSAWDTGGNVAITPEVEGLEEGAVQGLIRPPGGALLSAMGDVGGFRYDDLNAAPKTIFTSPAFTTTRSIDVAERNPKVIVRAGDFNDAGRPGDSHAAFSTDGGVTWFQGVEPSGVNSGGSIAAAADGSRFVWAPGDSGQQVVHSVGYGTSWTPSTGVPANAIIASDRVDPMKFYAFSNGTFHVSADGGASFTATAACLQLESARQGGTRARGRRLGGRRRHLDHLRVVVLDRLRGHVHRVFGVEQADNIGFGKAAPGRTYPALYTGALIGGQRGLFRSDDAGASWVRINDDRHRFGGVPEALTGDPAVYGQVYFSGYGRGVLYGDRSVRPLR